jgi:hypothetical protein
MIVICIILLLLLLLLKSRQSIILIDNKYDNKYGNKYGNKCNNKCNNKCKISIIEEVPNSPFSSEPNKKLSSSDILFLNSAKQKNIYDISKTLEDNLTNLLSTDHEYLVN